MVAGELALGVAGNFLFEQAKRALGRGRERFAPNIVQGRHHEHVKALDLICYDEAKKFRSKTRTEALKRYFSDGGLENNEVLKAILSNIFLSTKWSSSSFHRIIKDFEDIRDSHKPASYVDDLDDLRVSIQNRLSQDVRFANPLIERSIAHIQSTLDSLPKPDAFVAKAIDDARSKDISRYTRAFIESWQKNVRWLLVNGLDSKARREQIVNDLKSSYVPISLQAVEQIEADESNQTAENAMRELRKVIIRGDAGSGKTTLLHKKILDYDPNRDLFDQEIPLYIPLRRIEKDLVSGYLVETALSEGLGVNVINDKQPVEWLQDLTAISNNIVFMFDGIDEVRTGNRGKVWELIADTEKRFPNCCFIVTSRNLSAVHLGDGSYRSDVFESNQLFRDFAESWNPPSSFFDFSVRPFTNIEVANLIEKWFSGVDLNLILPQERMNIAGYAEELKAQIFSIENRGALDLARNPLLCALFCIVAFLDRGRLPHSRRDLYEKATNLLVATRDEARGVDVPPEFAHFGLSERLAILQQFALIMQEGASEGDANQSIEVEKIKAMEWADKWIDNSAESWAFSGTEMLKFLLERCTIIREPSIGRVDFVHRSFMEFLAAQEICMRRAPHSIRHTIFKDEWQNTLQFCMNTIGGGGHFAGQIFRDFSELIENSTNKIEKRSGHLKITSLLRNTDQLPEMYFDYVSSSLKKILPLKDYEEAKELFGVPASILNTQLKYDDILKKYGEEQTNICARLLANHPSDQTKIGLLTGYERIPDVQTISIINSRGKLDVNEHYALLKRIENKSYNQTVMVRPEELNNQKLRRGLKKVGIRFPIFENEFIGWDMLHFASSVKFLNVAKSDFDKMINSVKKWKFDSCKSLEIVQGNGVTLDDVWSLMPNLETLEITRGQASSFRGIEKLTKLREIWLIGVSQPIRIFGDQLPPHLETIMVSSSSRPIVEGSLGKCRLVVDDGSTARTLYTH